MVVVALLICIGRTMDWSSVRIVGRRKARSSNVLGLLLLVLVLILILIVVMLWVQSMW